MKEKLPAGEAWADEWVLTRRTRQRSAPGMRRQDLSTDRRRAAGLPTITMRQLRHSHATALLRAGVHPKVVQERLSHANISITLDICSSVLPTMQREAVERLVALIEPV